MKYWVAARRLSTARRRPPPMAAPSASATACTTMSSRPRGPSPRYVRPTKDYRGPGGQVLVDRDGKTSVKPWRTWDYPERSEQLTVPLKHPAALGDIRCFLASDRASRARPDPEQARGAGGGASHGGSSGSGSTGRGFVLAGVVLAGVELAKHKRARMLPQKQSSSTHGSRGVRALPGDFKGKVTRIYPSERVEVNWAIRSSCSRARSLRVLRHAPRERRLELSCNSARYASGCPR
jgi:hypothetical protein